jgi:hypothetical protein
LWRIVDAWRIRFATIRTGGAGVWYLYVGKTYNEKSTATIIEI